MTDLTQRLAAQDAQLAQQAARIDSFDTTRTADGKYRVDGGWDANEVVGKDGLRTNDQGQVSLWLNGEPAWHKLGKVAAYQSVDQVITDSGLDFTVETRPLMWASPAGLSTVIRGAGKATVRVDPDGTETQLGTVGNIYTPFQNREAFGFLQELVGPDGGTFVSAGELSAGSTVFVAMQLGDDIVLDAEGSADVIKKYVMFKNGHDGRSKLGAYVTPTRPVCANTCRWGVENAWTSWESRHTSGVRDRVAEARRTLKLVSAYYDAFALDASDLIRADMSNRAAEAFLREVVFPVDDDAKLFVKERAEAAQARTLSLFTNSPTNANVTGTRWGMAQAVTEYLDHYADVRAPKSLRLDAGTPKSVSADIARGARIINGTDDARKSEVHKALLTWKR